MRDLGSDKLVTCQTEVMRADAIAVTNDAALAHRQKRLSHAVEYSFDGSGVGQRLGDRRLHLVVVLINQMQQFEEVRFFYPRLLRRSLDFVAKLLVHRPINSFREYVCTVYPATPDGVLLLATYFRESWHRGL